MVSNKGVAKTSYFLALCVSVSQKAVQRSITLQQRLIGVVYALSIGTKVDDRGRPWSSNFLGISHDCADWEATTAKQIKI